MTIRSKQIALSIQQLDLSLEFTNATIANEKRPDRRSHANGLPKESVSKFGCRPPIVDIELGCILNCATVATNLLNLTFSKMIMSPRSLRCWMAGRVRIQWSSHSSTTPELVHTRQISAMPVGMASPIKSPQEA